MPAENLFRYCVWAAHDGAGHGHIVEAPNFACAAMEFVEVWHPRPDADHAVTVIVLDQDSGEQQCFVVDLSTAAVEPCD